METAAQLRLGKTAVKQLIATGQLKSVLVTPRARRVPVAAVDEFIDGLRDKGIDVAPALGR